jgi:plastocyanin
MRVFPLTLLAACLTLVTSDLRSEVHDVVVGNNFFSPNNLTIEVGDTVRWTNNSGGPHDVTADDFLWASVTSTSFVFERRFNSVEEILYHCTVHSSPGRDINNFQNGVINVIDSDAPGFRINSAISDNWFEPATNGQGFFIIVWEESKYIFLSWFTYETERPPEDAMAILGEPGHRWLTAQGPYDGDTAVLDVNLSAGGVFDSEEPKVDDAVKVGEMVITWTGCNSGVVSYALTRPEVSGEIPIQRIVLDNVPACEAAQTEPPQ